VTDDRGARLLSRRATARVTGLALLALGGWVTWTGVQGGAGGRYQFAIGSVFFAVVGWAVMVRGDSTTGPVIGAETLAVLPRTTPDGTAADGRRRQFKRLLDVAVIAVVAYLLYRAVVRSDPSSWLFAGLFVVVFLPGTRSQARLTDSGLVVTRYVFWGVPLDRTQMPWTAVYGYESTDDRLRIATEFGGDFTYDPERIEARDRVVGILEDRLPRL
jgi:hypothetical protein